MELHEEDVIYHPITQPYETGDTVKATLHGTDYQINVLILYAFKHFVLNQPFELRTEDEGYGKFDDVVLITQNNVEVIQVKHSKDIYGEFTINHLVTQSGGGKKVQLFKYFDSWFQHKDNQHFSCKLYTNHIASTDNGFNLCFNGFSFKPEFIDNPSPPLASKKSVTDQSALSDPNKIKYCSDHVFRSIKKYSTQLTTITPETRKNTLIKQFLRTVQLVLGQKNVCELTDHIKQLFRTHYNSTNDAIYYEFYCKIKNWLRDSNVSSHDQSTISALFSDSINNCLYLERLYGLTIQHLKKIKTTLSNGIQFKNNKLSELTSWINQSSSETLLLSGAPGIGKSSLVKQFHDSHTPRFIDGEFIFIDLLDVLSIVDSNKLATEPNRFNACKVFCLDNFEKFTLLNQDKRHRILKFILQAKENIRVIILTRSNDYQEILTTLQTSLIQCHSINMCYLQKHNVLKHLPHLSPLFDATNATIIKSNRGVDSYSLISGLTEQKLKPQVESIHHILLTPFYLNLIRKDAIKELSDITYEQTPSNIQKIMDQIILTSLKVNKDDRYKLFSKKLSILRQILYGTIKKRKNNKAIQSLIENKIIIKCEKNNYTFTHLLYEEFTVRQIVYAKLKELIESSEHPIKMIKFLVRHLSKYRYIWTQYLFQNKKLFLSISTHYALKKINPLLKRNNFFLILYMEILRKKITLDTITEGIGYNHKYLLDILSSSLTFSADYDPVNTAKILQLIEKDKHISEKLISKLMSHALASPLMVLCKHFQTFEMAATILLRHMSFHCKEDDYYKTQHHSHALYALGEIYGSGGPTFVSYNERISVLRKFAFSGHKNVFMLVALLGIIAHPETAASSYYGSKISKTFSDKNPEYGFGDQDEMDERFAFEKLLLLMEMHNKFKDYGYDAEPILIDIFDSYLSLGAVPICEFMLNHINFEDEGKIWDSIKNGYRSPYELVLVSDVKELNEPLDCWCIYLYPDYSSKGIKITVSHEHQNQEKPCLNNIELLASLDFPKDGKKTIDGHDELMYVILKNCQYGKNKRQAILKLFDKINNVTSTTSRVVTPLSTLFFKHLAQSMPPNHFITTLEKTIKTKYQYQLTLKLDKTGLHVDTQGLAHEFTTLLWYEHHYASLIQKSNNRVVITNHSEIVNFIDTVIDNKNFVNELYWSLDLNQSELCHGVNSNGISTISF